MITRNLNRGLVSARSVFPICAKSVVNLTASLAVLLGTPIAAHANPEVNGNLISWPDDGWYQVQSLPDYTSVCEGGRSCTVATGLYIVINHSSGERWESVAVVDESGGDIQTGVSVTGNSIRWPDDGWYQVQSLPDYASVCEGGRSCDVDAGEYVVINHNTGQRFDGIVVTGDGATDGNPSGSVVVSGNTISWQDNGWYQVQSASNYQSVCEGGRVCVVPPGNYNVINHTTGERFDSISVGDSESGDTGFSVGLNGFDSQNDFERVLKDALLDYYSTGDDGSARFEANFGDLAATSFATADVPAAAPVAETAADSAAGDSLASLDFTATNVQEAGVDEADRMKTDGRFLYVLGDSNSAAVPFPIGPVIDLPFIELDGELAAEPALATSEPFIPPTVNLRILELNSDAPDASLLSESDLQLGGYSVDGMYLSETDPDALFLTSSSYGGNFWGYWDSPAFWGTTRSSIHRMDVSDRTAPQAAQTVSFDGQIISSRVVGDRLYVASRYFPRPRLTPAEQSSVEDDDFVLEDFVASLAVDDLVPRYRRGDSEVVPLANYENCLVGDSPDSQNYRPDIITLLAINLDDLSLSDSACYLGQLDTLYASPNAAYLSTSLYGTGLALDGADPLRSGPTSLTEIHQFDFNRGALDYVGSGRVEGRVSGDDARRPFRFSASNGYLRVVTTNDAGVQPFEASPDALLEPDRSPVFVSVLKPGEGKSLELVTRLPNESQSAHIGKPGERLYASRFIGNKAYLVTFRQVDPLYVLDFSNNEDPRLIGELEVEGYSDYLHPVGENHLLGLGRGAIPDPFSGGGENGRGAFATGIKLSLFDVSDAANPVEVESLEIGKRGSNSEALFDHHGITLRQAGNGQPARLAIGISVNDIPTGGSSSPVAFYNWRETGLFAFELLTDTNAGISFAGKMIVEAASPQNPWGPQHFGDRSVLVNDAVFYIHGDEVYAGTWGSIESYNGPH